VRFEGLHLLSGKEGLPDLSVPAVNSELQRARVRLRERLPSRKPPWPNNVDASAARYWSIYLERELEV
jgi:hypothetical protein